MYPSSTASSSSQGNSMGTSTTINGGSNNSSTGLIRYASAPSSLISTAVDSVINPTREFSAIGSSLQQLHMSPSPTSSRYFPSSDNHHGLKQDGSIGGGGGAGMVSSSASPLVRHSSSPAGFLNHLPHACSSSSNQDNNGFSTSRGCGISRLNSQLSFTRQETLSRISEESENVGNGLNAENHDKRKSTHSYTSAGYEVGSWEDANTIMFSMEPSKRPKNMSSETQVIKHFVKQNKKTRRMFQFTMPETMLEMSSMDNMLNIPGNSVACKIRAKRGCATHPRSIAERERRTRISGKLKKLQDLVPNMDKQTSYADMLDLAVQHIKGLQNHVLKLNKELENCTCGYRKQ